MSGTSSGDMIESTLPQIAGNPTVVCAVRAEEKITAPSRWEFGSRDPSAHCVRSGQDFLVGALRLVRLGGFAPFGRAQGKQGNVSSSETFVRKEGVEPPRPCGHRILSPARLPVPPLPHSGHPTDYTSVVLYGVGSPLG